MEDNQNYVPIASELMQPFKIGKKEFKTRVIPLLEKALISDNQQKFEQLLKDIAQTIKKQKIHQKSLIKIFSYIKRCIEKFTKSKSKEEKRQKKAQKQQTLNKFGDFILILFQQQYLEKKSLQSFLHLLSRTETQIIKQRFEKALNANQHDTFNICAQILSKRKLSSELENVVLNKFLNEYFVDTKKRTTQLVFNKQLSQCISPKNFQEQILPKILHLIKRTEDNVEVVYNTLNYFSDKEYDTSPLAQEIVLEHLKQYYFSLNGQEKPSQAALSVLKKIKNPQTLTRIVDGINQIVLSTNDEKKRMPILQILEGACVALQYINEKAEIEKKIIQIFFDNLNALQNANDLQSLINILDIFFANCSPQYTYATAQNTASIKKALTIFVQNKYIQVAVSYFGYKYVQKYHTDRKVNAIQEQKDLQDLILNQIFLPNVKNQAKLVTNSDPYLASLQYITFLAYLGDNVALTEVRKNLKNFILSSAIYVNKNEYLYTKMSQLEANLFSQTALNIILVNEFWQKEEFSFENVIVLSNILSQTFLTGNFKGKISLKGLNLDDQQIANFINISLLSVFNSLQYFDDMERKIYPSKLNQLLSFILRKVHSLPLEVLDKISYIEYLPWIVYNQVTCANLKKQYINQIKKDEKLLNFYRNLVNTKKFYAPQLLVSEIFVGEKAKFGYDLAQFLIDLGFWDFLNTYNFLLDQKNFDDQKSVDDFEQQVNNFAKEFEENQAKAKQLLNQVGYNLQISEQLGQQLNQQKEQQQVIGKKNYQQKQEVGNKKNPPKQQQQQQQQYQQHIQFLDDEELKIKKKEDLKQKMLKYFRIVAVFFIKYSNAENVAENFFLNFHEGFFNILHVSETNLSYKEIMTNIFKKYNKNIKVQQALLLSEFAIEISKEAMPDDKHIKEFKSFQQLTNPKLHEQTFIISFLHKLNFHTIAYDGFDLDTRVSAMIFYQKLTNQHISYLQQLFEPFNNNINTLAANENTQILLEKLLLEANVNVSTLFREILNNTNAAKKTVLNTLVKVKGKINYVPEFEDIIKLRILNMDYNEEVKKLSVQVLNEFKYVINEEKINKFDFVQFISSHSVENVEKFSQLCLDFINDNPLLQNIFFTKFTHAADACFDLNISEEALTFFAKYVNLHINNLKEDQLPQLFNILVQKYCTPQLNMLMDESMQCGINLIKKFGQNHANQIVQVFDKYLKSNKPEDSNKQISSIVFLGVCAPYIKNKAIIETVSTKIVLLFRNGSHDLQKSLAKCLPELMNFFENAPSLIEKAAQNLPFESTFEEKRGQAYLIAGLLKGLGIKQFEELNMFKHLETENLDNKKGIQQKEAILLFLQAILHVFGRLFEPYIVRVMKVLMFFFGESNEKLKDLAISCTKLLMSRLTGYGVKVILPTLLQGLEDSSWRVKYNNLWALGNMAFCSPKQMSQCLPQIVPSLSNSMSDTHPKIRECASQSLTLIGSSIKNPEISEIVDILIKALSDPFDMNKAGLEILLKTRFVHYIDAPSLALVIPIVDYALAQNRETRPKEDACQVVGSISTLIKDPKDILPYMEILVAGLKSALADNNNEVRLFAAKAIGKISNTIGKGNTETYFKFIRDILESKTATSIERSGAAQAFSEIMCILGIEYFKSQLPFIFEKMADKQPWVREGYIGIFVFVPVILKDQFNAFIKDVLDSTIEYVSDEDEKTREIALRVLRILIQNFGETQTQLLCAPISEGLFSSNWRRRNSSAILCAEMLEILQKSVRQENNQLFEENIKKEETELSDKQKILYENYMSIYILRADEMEQIRLQCAQIWKNFVSNTPKTLKLGLPVLMQKLIFALTRGGVVQVIAKTAISNFCQKYGESFFNNITESLNYCIQEFQKNKDNESILGAILFFAEYCKNLQGLFLKQNQDVLVNILMINLYTKDSSLRQSVLLAVKIITEKIGDNSVLKSVLGNIFSKIKTITENDEEYDIYAKILYTLSQSKSERILQFIVPQVFQKPISSLLIDVITNNAEVYGQIIYKYFRQQGGKQQTVNNEGGIGIILDQIFDKSTDQNIRESLIYALNQLTINLDEHDSNTFILFIIDKIQDLNKTFQKNQQDENHLVIILQLLKYYMLHTSIHINDYNKDLINLITPYIFESQKEKIIKEANPILGCIFSPMNRRSYPELLSTFVLSLHTQLSIDKFKDTEYIPGFNLGDEEGEGVQNYVEVLTKTVVYSPNKNFNDQMDMFLLLIKYTTLNNLQGFNFKLTGTIVRFSNYRLEIQEKERLLEVLVLLFKKGLQIKAFFSQLLYTFVKVINEFPRERYLLKKIAENLIELSHISSQKDQILSDMWSRYQENEEQQVKKEAFLYIVYRLIKNSSKKTIFSITLTQKIFHQIIQFQSEQKENNDINLIQQQGKIVGVISKVIHQEKLQNYLKDWLVILDKSNEQKYVFECMVNLLNIFEKNNDFQEVPQELGRLINKCFNETTKEYQYVSSELIKEVIERRRDDNVSKYLKENIDQKILNFNIDQDEELINQSEN